MEQLWKFPFLNLRDGQGIARDEIGIRGRHTPRRKPVRGAELGGGRLERDRRDGSAGTSDKIDLKEQDV
jgi:hypothetical protein